MTWIVILLINSLLAGYLVRLRKYMTWLELCVVYLIAAFICQVTLVVADVNLGWLVNKSSKAEQVLIALDSIVAFPALVTIWMNGFEWASRSKKWWFLLGAFISVELMESVEVWMRLYAFKSGKIRLLFDTSWIMLLFVTCVVWWLYKRYALRRGVSL